MNGSHKEFLEKKFGNRVNFNEMERVLYSHDIAAIPSLISPLIGKTVPDAVVQPQNEEELVDLVNWARQNNIALTPGRKRLRVMAVFCRLSEALLLISFA